MIRVAIIVSRFNHVITESLLTYCRRTLLSKDILEQNIAIQYVPGAYEIPIVAQTLAEIKKYDVIIALGAVVRGETPHFDYVCQQVSSGTMRVSLECKIPVIFGVLTTDTLEQAKERSQLPVGNKGEESALCAIEMVQTVRSIRGEK